MAKKGAGWSIDKRDLDEMLKLFGRKSIFLFDTETTSLDERKGQIWEIGGYFYNGNRYEEVHYYLASTRNQADIDDTEVMYLEGRTVKLRHFFFGTGPDTLSGKAKANGGLSKIIPADKLFDRLAGIGVFNDTHTLFAAFNIGFDMKFLNRLFRGRGFTISRKHSLDYQALVLDILPKIRNSSFMDEIGMLPDIPSVKRWCAARGITDPEIIDHLVKLNQKYRQSEIVKNRITGEEITREELRKLEDQAKKDGLPSVTINYLNTGKYKIGQGRYNLEKVRTFITNPVVMARTLTGLRDDFDLKYSDQDIKRCLADIAHIATKYHLNEKEAHQAVKDTVQMFGIGVVMQKLNELIGVHGTNPGSFDVLINIMIGYSEGDFNPATGRIVGSNVNGTTFLRKHGDVAKHGHEKKADKTTKKTKIVDNTPVAEETPVKPTGSSGPRKRDEGKVEGRKAEIIDEVIKALEYIPGLTAKPSATYEEDHTYDIFYYGKQVRTSRDKTKVFLPLKGVDYAVDTYRYVDIGRGKKKKTVELRLGFTDKEHGVPCHMPDSYNSGKNPVYYVAYFADGELYTKEKPTSGDIFRLGEKSWYDITSTTTLGKAKLGNKYADFTSRRRTKVLNMGARSVEQLGSQLEHEMSKEKSSATEKGTLVHKVIEIVERNLGGRSAKEIYIAIVQANRSKIPNDIYEKLKKQAFGGSFPVNWQGKNELECWAALRSTKEVGIPDNVGIETETPIAAIYIDPTTKKRHVITGSVDGMYKNLLLDFKNTQWINPDNPDWYFQLQVYKRILELHGKKINKAEIIALVPKNVDSMFREYVSAYIDDDFRVMSFEEYRQKAIISPTAKEYSPIDFGGSFIDPKTGKTIENIIRIEGRMLASWIREYFNTTNQIIALEKYFGDANKTRQYIGSKENYDAFAAKYPTFGPIKGKENKRGKAIHEALCEMYDYLLRTQKNVFDVFRRAWSYNKQIPIPGTEKTADGATILKLAIRRYMAIHGQDDVSKYGIKSIDEFFDLLGKELHVSGGSTKFPDRHKGKTLIFTDDGYVQWYEYGEDLEQAIEDEITREQNRIKEQGNIRLDSFMDKGDLQAEFQTRRELHMKMIDFWQVYARLQGLILDKSFVGQENSLTLVWEIVSQLSNILTDIKGLVGKEPYAQEIFDDFLLSIEQGNVQKFQKALSVSDPDILAENVGIFHSVKNQIHFGRDEFKRRIKEIYKNQSKTLMSLVNAIFSRLYNSSDASDSVSAEKLGHIIAAEVSRITTENRAIVEYSKRHKIKSGDLAATMTEESKDNQREAIILKEFFDEFKKLMNKWGEDPTSIAQGISDLIDWFLDKFNLRTPEGYNSHTNTMEELAGKLDWSEFTSGEEDDTELLGFQVDGDFYRRFSKRFLNIIRHLEELLDASVADRVNFANTLIRQLDLGDKVTYQSRTFAHTIIVDKILENADDMVVVNIPAQLFDVKITSGTNKISLEAIIENLITRLNAMKYSNSETGTLLKFINDLIFELLLEVNNKSGRGRAFAERLVAALGMCGICWHDDRRSVFLSDRDDLVAQAEATIVKYQTQGIPEEEYEIARLQRLIDKIKEEINKGGEAVRLDKLNQLLNDLNYYMMQVKLTAQSTAMYRALVTIRQIFKAHGIVYTFPEFSYEIRRDFEMLFGILKGVVDFIDKKHLATSGKYPDITNWRNEITILLGKVQGLYDQYKVLNEPELRVGDTAGGGDKGTGGGEKGVTPGDYVTTSHGNMMSNNIVTQNLTVKSNVTIEGNVVVHGETVSGSGGGGPINSGGGTTGSASDPLAGSERTTFVGTPTSKTDIKSTGSGYGVYTVTESGVNSAGEKVTKVSKYNAVIDESTGGWKQGDTPWDVAYKFESGGVTDNTQHLDDYRSKLEQIQSLENDIVKERAAQEAATRKGNVDEANGIQKVIDALETKKKLAQESADAMVAGGMLTATEAATIQDEVKSDTAVAAAKAKLAESKEDDAQRKAEIAELSSLMDQETALMKEIQKLDREDATTSKYNIVGKRGIREAREAAETRLEEIRSKIDPLRTNVDPRVLDELEYKQHGALDTNLRKLRTTKGGALNLWQGLQQALYQTTTRLTGIGLAYRIIGQIEQSFRQVIQYAKELDKVFVNLRIVTGGTAEETQSLMWGYSQLAKQIGATTSEIANSGNEWFNS